jgi:hypothetical protein
MAMIDVDVSEVHATSIFRVEVCRFVSCCVYIYSIVLRRSGMMKGDRCFVKGGRKSGQG